jgi:mannose-6-phosphate isomerase-like protein (cupin superfamily)
MDNRFSSLVPELFPEFEKDVPNWDYFINHNSYAYHSGKTGPSMLRIFDNYYFVTEVFFEDIPSTIHGYRKFYDAINSMHPRGIQSRPVFLMNIVGGVGALGNHADACDQIYWQCVGESYWTLELPDGTLVEYTLRPGDMIFIPTGTKHSVVSKHPRAGMTFSSN